MASCFLGLDYGTGGTKAALVDGDDGSLIGYAFEEYPVLTPNSGWSEHDPDRYWDAASRIIPRAIAEAGISPADIAGMAVSSALPSLVMVDAAGDPVANAYNLMDRRATDVVDGLKERFGEAALFARTKNRLDDHPAIVNLLWERANRPEIFRQTAKALTIDGFVTSRLTGRSVCHYGGAAFYGVAYDLLGRRFDQDLLERLDLDVDLLPSLHASTDIIGEVTPQAAAVCGLAPGTPVAAGQVDCNAGWSGAGAVCDGDIQMNLGTCGNFGVVHSQPVFHESMIACNYTTDTVERPTFITIPTTSTGGMLIRYLRDTFYLPGAKLCEDPYERINRDAETAPPGSDGLIVLPFLMGERTPLWDPHARGVVFGLSLNHTRGHVARAMMESVAYALYHSFTLIETAGQRVTPPIVLNEGGAKSVLWRRIITDVFNLPTVLVKRRAGAPYGDAVLAGIAAGKIPDFNVTRDWTEHIDPMEPDPVRHEQYLQYFELYKKLYEDVKDDFRRLSRLRAQQEGLL